MSVFQVLRGRAVINFATGTRIVIQGKVVTTFQVPTSATAIPHQRILVLVIYRPLARQVVIAMSIVSSARVTFLFLVNQDAIVIRIVPVLVLVTAPALVMGAVPVIQTVRVERVPVIQRHLAKAIALATVIALRRPAALVIPLIIVMPAAKLAIQNAHAFVMRPLIVREIAPVTLIAHVMSSVLAM